MPRSDGDEWVSHRLESINPDAKKEKAASAVMHEGIVDCLKWTIDAQDAYSASFC